MLIPMVIPIVLIVISITIAAFSDHIDRKHNSGGQLKKVLLVFSAGVFCISAIALAAMVYGSF